METIEWLDENEMSVKEIMERVDEIREENLTTEHWVDDTLAALEKARAEHEKSPTVWTRRNLRDAKVDHEEALRAEADYERRIQLVAGRLVDERWGPPGTLTVFDGNTVVTLKGKGRRRGGWLVNGEIQDSVRYMLELMGI